LQEQFSEDAMARMKIYQKKIKGLLKTMEDEAADEVEKHLNKARSAMEDWLKEASKNLPAGSDKFTDIVRDVSEAGQKVLKEGRRMAKQAAEAAEQGLADLEKMSSGAGKKSASPASKKPAAKKVVRKAAKKVVKKVAKPTVKKVVSQPTKP
jgi:glutamyl-tRNA reductase